ncbi:DUF6519 domain-containing protein [Nostoc parmelioides]|uniref:Tail fiber protein n=1 Tax=Nostoc parmelioides FACHB-3921 TaxID=2692909 RepID=A0ABR8BKJ5_9NOSO|nr:DUF6519 domain-containing protein [Nostoc parmelioides]MBD2253375.1 tail fiber protein [Nostoc parmelioides FACHB-3921]
MKGDFSRFTFNPQKRFSRVLMQQGRVQLDADWNEQLDITEHRIATEITDFIGQSGAPEKYAGFEITADNKTNLKIGEGRYYVEGMLVENDQSVLFTAQSDYSGAKLPTENGIYLAYLDVWQRHITALEDPEIREPALGGADTATRVKNIWQVKLQKVDNKAEKSSFAPPDWKPSWENPISTGKLSASIVGAGANLENQLYRVEIHKSGKVGEATFKWSRDNGSIATRVEKIVGQEITISRLGQDIQTAFAAGNWVEITTEKQTLSGEPGLLVELASVTANTLTVKEWTDGKAPKFEPPMIVRRWDSGEIAVQNKQNDWITLENEIQVKFDAGNYKTGDYWLIPTRNLTANIESPGNEAQPPHGILHRYCSLALVEYNGSQFTVKDDCRVIFKPLTTGLLSKGGDTMTGTLTIDKDLYVTGNVSIGTTKPEEKMEIEGGNLKVSGCLIQKGYDFVLGKENKGDRGDTGLSRALVKNYNSILVINYANDFKGGVKIDSNLEVTGNVGIGTTSPQEKLHVNGRIKDKTGWVMPVGSILPYAGSTAPEGWFICDGSEIDTKGHEELFGVIGTQYGRSEDKFKLPDLKGRIPVGLSTSESDFDSLGKKAGSTTHTLTIDEMPEHNHGVTDPGHSHNIYLSNDNGKNTCDDAGADGRYLAKTTEEKTNITIQKTGGGRAHNNLQPYITMNYIIKY